MCEILSKRVDLASFGLFGVASKRLNPQMGLQINLLSTPGERGVENNSGGGILLIVKEYFLFLVIHCSILNCFYLVSRVNNSNNSPLKKIRYAFVCGNVDSSLLFLISKQPRGPQ